MSGTWKMNRTWSFLFFSWKCQEEVNHRISKQQGRTGKLSDNTRAAHSRWMAISISSDSKSRQQPFQRAASCRSVLAVGTRRHFLSKWESVYSVAVQKESRDSFKTLGWPRLPTAVNIWLHGWPYCICMLQIICTILLRMPTQNEAAPQRNKCTPAAR